MRRGIIAVIATTLFVLFGELALHWYAAKAKTATARRLASAYYYRDPVNLKTYVQGVVDLVVPAVAIGVILGAFGTALAPRHLIVGILILSLGVVALQLLYGRFFPDGGVRWWLRKDVEGPSMGDWIAHFLCALALCGFFTFAARGVVIRRSIWRI